MVLISSIKCFEYVLFELSQASLSFHSYLGDQEHLEGQVIQEDRGCPYFFLLESACCCLPDQIPANRPED